ncbi:MAG: glycoside hydrolase family 65 protein [Bacteroidetes bacterium]|nr:glycoside hydrolase family 65 protein [Bacteroidota bacterium]
MSRMRVVEEIYKKSTALNFESMFTQGNGYIHTRGTLEEKYHSGDEDREYLRKPFNVTVEEFPETDYQAGTYIPVIVGPHPLLNTVSINLPGFWGFKLTWNGESLMPNEDNFTAHERVLNLNNGELVRKTRWATSDGAEIEVTYKRFISKAEKHLSMLSIELDVKKGCGKLGVVSGINAGFRTNGYNHFTNISCDEAGDLIYARVDTNGNDRVTVSSCLYEVWDSERGNEAGKLSLHRGVHGNEVLFSGDCDVEQGFSISFEKSIVISTSQDALHQMNSSVIDYHRVFHEQARKAGYTVLAMESALEWEIEWKNAACRISGDDKVQEALEFSLYHLLRSQEKRNDRITVCPKGFAGEAYFGRFFWDTEAFLLPFFIYTDPARARDLVMFRYNTLEGAKRNAKDSGYEGAKYAWESSLSGDEECPNWQYADHEIHVTADVAYGVWHYISIVEDIDFLEAYGFEILWETAKFWESRVDRFDDDSIGYAGVMGPDEYSPFSTNNVFTNEMARFNLTVVNEAWEVLQRERPLVISGLTDRLGIGKVQLQHMQELAESIVKPEIHDGVIMQCKEFPGFVSLPISALRTDDTIPVGTLVSQERLYRSKLLKQADVLAYMTLFPKQFLMQEFRKNLQFYEPVTSHDSSLSYSIHALAAAYAGNEEETARFFNKALYLDYNLENGRVERGIHIANAAGVWQILVSGFCGIRTNMWSRILEIYPCIPDGLGDVNLRFVWKGNIFDFTINNKVITVKTIYNSKMKDCCLQIFRKQYEIPITGNEICIKKADR